MAFRDIFQNELFSPIVCKSILLCTIFIHVMKLYIKSDSICAYTVIIG